MNYFFIPPSLENMNCDTQFCEPSMTTCTAFLLYLVWHQNNNIAQPECKAQYELANHYYLTRTHLLPAYVADWMLLSK